MNKTKLETLVIARAFTTMDALSSVTLAKTLRRFAPLQTSDVAWRTAVDTAIADLQQRGAMDARNRLRDRDLLTRRIGRHTAKRWQQLAERVLPALALDIAPDDIARHKRLAGRDEWAAAMVARALDLWTAGPPPTLPALCDALAWRELGLAGRPKRCPAEVRACFVQRQLGGEAGSPERLVRLLAAQLVGAPRAELRGLRDALVRNWLLDRALVNEPALPPQVRIAALGAGRAAVEPMPAGAHEPSRPAPREASAG
jgi:hypothetical protein